MKLKVLITGVNGLLGQALVHTLKGHYQITGIGLEEQAYLPTDGWEYHRVDITRTAELKAFYKQLCPDFIVNTASFTNVDRCEVEKELCWRVNVKGIENLAMMARRNQAHVVHYSTDYIFDGKNGPYSEDDRPNPINYYGKSKLASENTLLKEEFPVTIVRTCVLYGTGARVKTNFFLWVLEKLQQQEPFKVVTDQYNNPTLVEDLAMGTQLILDQQMTGIFNLAGPEVLNRLEFARLIARVFGYSPDLIGETRTETLNQLAKRPVYGGLKIDLARVSLGYAPRPLNEALEYLKRKIQQHG